MRNLNEGKKKSSSYMAELAEIDKQSSIVAMEAKINKLAEMVKTKNARLSMVSEDENLSELISKQAVKEMQRSIKEIEKAKMKLEKLYEKMTGNKKKEVVDGEMDDKINPGNTEDDQAKKDDYNLDAMPAHMKEGEYSTYEEDDVEEGIEDELKKNKGKTWDEAEPAQVTKEKGLAEEYLRMQKLAGVISEEEYKNRLNEAAGEDLEIKSLAKKFIPIIKKYGMKVEYETDTNSVEMKPEKGGHGVPAKLIINKGDAGNSMLTVAVYWLELADSMQYLKEIDVAAVPPQVYDRADEQANKMYKELMAVVPEGEFESIAPPNMNKWGNYLIHFRKK